jgi:molybdopterin molybdotransferase
MVRFEEAVHLILKHTPAPKSGVVSLGVSLGKVLATDIIAPYDSPPFDQSAMDGYAVDSSAIESADSVTFRLTDSVQAGKTLLRKVKKGETARIFTGAALPKGTDTVVVQEQSSVNGAMVTFPSHLLTPWKNVRRKGSHVRKGEKVMEAGDLMTSGAIAFLASIGISKVSVFLPPVLHLVVTGDELQSPGEKLKPGHIYESNSIALKAAFEALGVFKEVKVYRVNDSLKRISKRAAASLENADVVIFTGGVSVGDYDFVVPALESAGVKTGFHKVKQKPGKPVFFGYKGRKLVFALPGNPASVLTCFYTLVMPALSKLCQRNFVEFAELPSLNSFQCKPGMTQILKAYTDATGVQILPHQESYKLDAFVSANSLVILDENQSEILPGMPVNVLLFPTLRGL